ncbi:type I toxin-antitoxin system toxin Ldr family protein [Escherichia coli]|nr:type I toxin-antitoxin system toxin Ldr family protein [Escherichia coli]
MHLTTSRGLILNMAFWHDLAAPVIAGILASLIVNWLNKRK